MYFIYAKFCYNDIVSISSSYYFKEIFLKDIIGQMAQAHIIMIRSDER